MSNLMKAFLSVSWLPVIVFIIMHVVGACGI